MHKSLTAGGWTGVAVIDAGNDPDWSGIPIDPATGKPMTESQRRFDLAAALALVRTVLKLQGGYSLLAANGPPSVIDFTQINSTDAVTTGVGFAHLSGPAWNTELNYYRQVGIWESGTYVPDRGPLSRAQAVYGLAGFLLVQIQRSSAYVAPDPAGSPLYAIQPGKPPDSPPVQQGPVWLRTYPNGMVAVNPSNIAATVTLGAAGQVVMGPESAAIETNGHLITSG